MHVIPNTKKRIIHKLNRRASKQYNKRLEHKSRWRHSYDLATIDTSIQSLKDILTNRAIPPN